VSEDKDTLADGNVHASATAFKGWPKSEFNGQALENLQAMTNVQLKYVD
jgi:hypothetical protein